MKTIVIAALLALPLVAYSDPAPFGLEIGKVTIKDVKEKYGVQRTGINKYSGGEMYDLSGVEFDGLKEVTVIFGKDGRLLAVLTTFSKRKFDSLLNGLSKKYQLVSRQVPFVGDKSAKLIDGDTEITLIAPHLSFEMKMNYINKDLWKVYEEQSNRERQKKRMSEQSQL